MKTKIVILLLLFSFTLGASAQSKWDGFFHKKNGTPVTMAMKAEGEKSYDLSVRPTVNMNAMVLSYSKETKVLETSAFSAVGIGVGLQHYEEVNGILQNDYGANLLLIINGAQPDQAGFGLAVTVNALQFVNVGVAYDFTYKRPMGLIGVSYSF
jgi:hypothetical protein